MTNEQLLFQAANASDLALKAAKAAWESKHLPRAVVERLVEQTRLAHCAATELAVRARATITTDRAAGHD